MPPNSIESPDTTARLAGFLWLVVIIVSIAEVVAAVDPRTHRV